MQRLDEIDYMTPFYEVEPADSEEPQPVDYWRYEWRKREITAALSPLVRAETDLQKIDHAQALNELERTSTEYIWNDIYTARKALNDAIYAACRETYPVGKHTAHDPFWQQAVNRADTIGIALAALAGVTEVTAEVRV